MSDFGVWNVELRLGAGDRTLIGVWHSLFQTVFRRLELDWVFAVVITSMRMSDNSHNLLLKDFSSRESVIV